MNRRRIVDAVSHKGVRTERRDRTPQGLPVARMAGDRRNSRSLAASAALQWTAALSEPRAAQLRCLPKIGCAAQGRLHAGALNTLAVLSVR
jgi:hypothetical protein